MNLLIVGSSSEIAIELIKKIKKLKQIKIYTLSRKKVPSETITILKIIMREI